jgi:hypothetical protein
MRLSIRQKVLPVPISSYSRIGCSRRESPARKLTTKCFRSMSTRKTPKKRLRALIKASDPIEPDVVTCVCRFNENGDDCDSIGSLLASVGSLQKAYRGDSRTSVLGMAEE